MAKKQLEYPHTLTGLTAYQRIQHEYSNLATLNESVEAYEMHSWSHENLLKFVNEQTGNRIAKALEILSTLIESAQTDLRNAAKTALLEDAKSKPVAKVARKKKVVITEISEADLLS